MRYLILATLIAVVAGCANLDSAAQGGSTSSWNRQDNNGYPYNSHYN